MIDLELILQSNLSCLINWDINVPIDKTRLTLRMSSITLQSNNFLDEDEEILRYFLPVCTEVSNEGDLNVNESKTVHLFTGF